MLQVSNVSRARNGLRGLGDARENAITLQLAANRYAAHVRKTPIATDGIIGSATLAMVRAALQYLAARGSVSASSASSAATAAGLLPRVTTVAQVTTSAVGLSTFLNEAMDAIKLETAAWAGSDFVQLNTKPATAFYEIPGSGATTPPQQTPPQQDVPPSQQDLTRFPPPVVVGLSPGAKKGLMIAGGLIVGLVVLKALI